MNEQQNGATAVQSPASESCYLDDSTALRIRGLVKANGQRSWREIVRHRLHLLLRLMRANKHPRWQDIAHCIDRRHSLILLAGEEAVIDQRLLITGDSVLFVRYAAALPVISNDGLVLELVFTAAEDASKRTVIGALPVGGGKQPATWRTAEFDLSPLAGASGHFSLGCQPGPENDDRADWLAIADFCIARQDLLPLYRAKSFHGLRSKNEIAHFSQVYKHEMYTGTQDRQARKANADRRIVRQLQIEPGSEENRPAVDIPPVEPLEDETPYGYAYRLLATQIPQQAPDFAERLKQRSDNNEVVRVLSLCSGAARMEAGFAAHAGANVEWSLLDINSELLQTASAQFSADLSVDLIEANANELQASDEKWDIILCVSALHHIVELEKLVSFCHQSLNPGGEFWSIGEYIGRNGNRLWPDAMVCANQLFRELPEKYRRNQHSRRVDDTLPDNDYSVGCFEGIRSEDIVPLLDRWFQPVEELRQNCFLWRAINLAYSDNYDLSREEDRHWIRQIVRHEVMHFRDGGRGTELFGVFSPRMFAPGPST